MEKPHRSGPMQYLMSYTAWLGSTVRSLAQRLRPTRNDELGRERGQTIVRAVIVALMLLYLYVGQDRAIESAAPPWFAWVITYFVLSIAIAIWAHRDHTSRTWRHTLMNIGDVVTISATMITTGKLGIPLFVLYLWITLGNGFRFGTRAMIVSAVLSLVGFSVVTMSSPMWQELTMVSAAIMLFLIALPLYCAHTLHHRAINGADRSAPANAPTSVAAGLKERMRQAFQRVRLKRHDELGREQGQSIVRLVISSSVLAYLIVSHYPVDLGRGLPGWLIFLASFIAFSTMLTIHALRDTRSSVPRRTLANAGDVVAISYLMASTGEAGIPLFVLYLWITLGNGFRFGVRAMCVSALLSLLGFAAVIAASELWRAHPMLAASVIIGLILIPGYTAHLIRQLHLAKQRAEEASAAKGHFLARMSHELRTPLNGILGTTELLAASKRFNREDRSLLNVIRDSVKVSIRQIDNVLDFSKMEAGKLQIEQVDFDLHELLHSTARLVRGIAIEKGLRLMLRIDPALPYRLKGDPHHVQEVLINLVSNAVKFTDKGQVSIEARLLDATEHSALVCIEVHDTGIGIEPAALRHIFDAFVQENSGTTRHYGGTGLGTTIAKQLVELMGGRLNVTSTKGQGSTFSAEIPFARQATDAEAVDRLTGARLLLISKDAALHDRLSGVARELGVSLQVVPTAAEAEGLLRRGMRIGNPLHVVLADSHAVLTCSGTHCADDFLGKAALAFTPVYLVCDVVPEAPHLRQWGYAGALSYDLPRRTLFNAVHVGSVSDSDAPGVVRVEPWAWAQQPRQRARLLVADDNRTNLMILRKILETANFDVDTVEDGEQALDMLLRGRYKAAVMDMHMPGLDGIAVIKQYRIMHTGARTRIVMLTANATVDAKLESAEAGADAYLSKPATASTIIATIERVLDDTEVFEISRRRASDPAAQEVPVLDTSVLVEVDRMYNSPVGIGQILDEFESESRRLLDAIGRAVFSRNHAAFCDSLRALKGNGANVGALRLAQTCQEAEAYGILDFRRDGEQLLQRLENALADAARALRDFIATGEPGPAQGTETS